MAKTYSPTLTTDRDRVRFLIGDNQSSMVLDDGEIDWLLSTEANVYMAAGAAADAIVTAMQGAVSGVTGPITRKRIGQTDISYANGRSDKQYATLAERLRARGRGHQTGFAGGISIADKLERELDTDRPSNRLRTGQFDSTAAGGRDPRLGIDPYDY